MIDSDLATLYQVTTGNLNLAVRRNAERFPQDFMFQLTEQEFADLSLHFAISKKGGRRYLPYAFTEHGVAMLSAVLKSRRALQMSILIVRAFVKLREMIASNQELADRLERLETMSREHSSVINILAEEIEYMKAMPIPPARRIGFPAD
jgi:ORF6N domain